MIFRYKVLCSGQLKLRDRLHLSKKPSLVSWPNLSYQSVINEVKKFQLVLRSISRDMIFAKSCVSVRAFPRFLRRVVRVLAWNSPNIIVTSVSMSDDVFSLSSSRFFEIWFFEGWRDHSSSFYRFFSKNDLIASWSVSKIISWWVLSIKLSFMKIDRVWGFFSAQQSIQTWALISSELRILEV